MKRFLTILAGMALAVGSWANAVPVNADDTPVGYVTMALEINTLGDGFLYEPVKVPCYPGEKLSHITDRFLGGAGNYRAGGSLDADFYLTGIKLPRDIAVNAPQIILASTGALADGPGKAGEFLAAGDYFFMAGWMPAVNGALQASGAAQSVPANGDVVRWQFSLYGYGADLGLPDSGWGTPSLFAGADKDALLAKVAELNSAPNKAELLSAPAVLAAYKQANAALTALTIAQSGVDTALTALTAALTTPANPPSTVNISAELSATLAKLVTTVPAPTFGTGGGEWTVLALARAGHNVPSGYFDGYYQRIAALVGDTGKFPNTPTLDANKSSENSRLILALSAIGKDARSVGGLNLILPLSDFSFVTRQGLNGPVFALLALDANDYAVPDIAVLDPGADTAKQNTRQRMVDYILDKETANGGWALSGSTADPDMTAMSLQALAPYRSQPEVAAAVNRAVAALSTLQRDNGGFASWGTVNAESIAQVVVALTGLGIDPATDSRFVKANGNTVSALLDFFVPGGGFSHTLSGAFNNMATDQGGYALVAYDRLVKGKQALFDMTDAFESNPAQPPVGEAGIVIETLDQVSATAGTEFNLLVKASAFPEGSYKLMDGLVNIPAQFSVASVAASDRLSGGTLSWKQDAEGKLRFVYTNTDLSGIALSGTEFPAMLLTVRLRVMGGVDPLATPKVLVSVGGVTLKSSADQPAFVFDVTQAAKEISFTPSGIAVSAWELFTGDGIDLIPASKRAVAVAFTGIGNNVAPAYKGNALIYSAEFSNKLGVSTYVLLTTPGVPITDLALAANYSFPAGAPATLRFGDSDSNNIINAQDALDGIGAWLRVNPVTTDQQILRLNVTSDSRINTFDALSVMENYVSNVEFPILNK